MPSSVRSSPRFPTLRSRKNPHSDSAERLDGPFQDQGYGALHQENRPVDGYRNLKTLVGITLQACTKELQASPSSLQACTKELQRSPTALQAWTDALAGDPVSAFGGIIICNCNVDAATAESITKLFFEIIIAPSFDEKAFAILSEKKNRIILKLKNIPANPTQLRSALNGMLVQDKDKVTISESTFKYVTDKKPTPAEIADMVFANKLVRNTKSNAIILAKNNQLMGSGAGQTSRVDALNHAIAKAKHFGFDLQGAVMSSDAFFPFPDCVEIAHKAGITAVIQPGGSIKDKESIEYCNKNALSMVLTGNRHFKH